MWRICGQSHVRRGDDMWAESCKTCGGSVCGHNYVRPRGGSVGQSYERRVEDLSVGTIM